MSSVELSDALIEAMSRAAALPLHRPVAWPPASVPRLHPGELAEDLQRMRNLARGPELTIVALAEAGDAADPALRAELAAHARDEFVDLPERPTTALMISSPTSASGPAGHSACGLNFGTGTRPRSARTTTPTCAR